MTSANPHVAWSAHLNDPEKRKEFIQTIKSSRTLIERFLVLLDQMETTIVQDANSLKQYDNPAWPYRQAHQNGRHSAIKQIRDLFTNL